MENKKILHLMFDGRFVDATLNVFEKANPGQHRYIVLTSGTKANLKLVHERDKIEIFPWNINIVLKEIKRHNIVFLHWLDDFKKELVLKSPENIKFVWVCWGGDLYEAHQSFKNAFIMPETRKLIEQYNAERKRRKLNLIIFDILKKAPSLFNMRRLQSLKALFFKSKKYLSMECFDSALRRIGYIACLGKEEGDYVRQYVDIKSEFVEFIGFGTLNDFIPECLQKESVSGNNILMGNSATTTNNHLDFFKECKHLKLENRKLICPLSYGEDWYKHAIIKEGGKLFGEKFHPLTEYLTLPEYNKILLSCSVMVSNHIRSQGVGNIISGLYLGMKVFLNEDNFLYSFFQKRGFIVFSLQNDFYTDDKHSFTQLSEDDRYTNRKKVIEIWNQQAVLSRIRNIAKRIIECNE